MNPTTRRATHPLFGPPAELSGIVPFTGERSQRGFALNTFLVAMRSADTRAAFGRDEAAFLAQSALSAAERELVRRRDYAGMLEHGASVYAIGKASQALGATLLEIGAAQRGMTPQAFVAMRRSERSA